MKSTTCVLEVLNLRNSGGLIQTPQRRDGALAGASGFIAETLNQLHVGVAAASGELGEHDRQCSKKRSR